MHNSYIHGDYLNSIKPLIMAQNKSDKALLIDNEICQKIK